MEQSFVVDLDWYQENDRSFSAFVSSRLCTKHQKKLGEKPAEILATVHKCCSKEDTFLTKKMPLLESVFRLLLAGGNQPTSLDELVQRLSELRGSAVNSETLRRLLKGDEFYGLRAVSAENTDKG